MEDPGGSEVAPDSGCTTAEPHRPAVEVELLRRSGQGPGDRGMLADRLALDSGLLDDLSSQSPVRQRRPPRTCLRVDPGRWLREPVSLEQLPLADRLTGLLPR